MNEKDMQVPLEILSILKTPLIRSFALFSSCDMIQNTKDHKCIKKSIKKPFFKILRGKMVCPQTTEENHKGVIDQRKTSRYYLLSLSELSLVLRCLWRFILTHPKEKKKKLMATVLPENHRLLADAKLFTLKAKLLWRGLRHRNNPSSVTMLYFCKQPLDHSTVCETEHPENRHASAGQSLLLILQKEVQPASWFPAGQEWCTARLNVPSVQLEEELPWWQ